MPVLSNNGRLISSLPVTSTVSGQDELLLQSSGITKRINYATLSSSILNTSNFNPFNGLVNFKNQNNKFTGSFYNPNSYSSNFYTVNVRNSLSVSNGITGNVTGNVTGNITSPGTSTFSTIDVTGGNIDGTIIGTSVAAAITGTTITATTGFSGNITGNVTGNITSTTGISTFTTIDVNGGTIDGATINSTTIGATSATTITGTTITANTGFSGNITGNVTGNVTGNITSPGTSTFTTIDVNGGTIDGATINSTTIGATSATTITGTTITANTGFSGNITSTTGTSTFSTIDVNGGNIDGTIIGTTVAAAITGTTITANTGFSGNLTGNVTGNLTGDVYNANSNKILENGSGAATSNGGYPNAFFYGTSSYANQALTAAYAAYAASSVSANGVPVGGSQYKILAKNSGTDYDAIWTNPITSSNPGNPYNLVVWDGSRSIRDYNNFGYDGTSTYTCTAKLRSTIGIEVTGGAFTGSFVGNSQIVTVPTGTGPTQYIKIYGHNNSSVKLKLSASAYCTMSLLKGQSTSVLVENSGLFKVLKWSGSLDGGNTVSTKVYWKNGLSASITQGDQKKDIITFVNIDNKIFGSAVNTFQ